MYGHRHVEKITVQTSVITHEPIGLVFKVGGMVTGGKNPSFDVLHLDPETMLPQD